MNPDRRTFLRSACGATLALPLLDSLGWKAFASNKTTPPPKRLAFLSFGWGVTEESWYPDKKKIGRDFELSKGLQPLARHKDDITVIQNLHHQFNQEAHWGSTFYLTGANRYAEPGKSFSNTVSADQVAAKEWGKETRFSSLRLSCVNAEGSGHGPGLSLSWDQKGKPMAGFENPVRAYNKLFSDGSLSLEESERLLDDQRSVLDLLNDDAKRLAGSLGVRDRDKLDEYLQSVRDIEVRLSKETSWLSIPKKRPQGTLAEVPSAPVDGHEEIKLMYDIIIAAMQTDSTRVVTYRQPVEALLRSMDIQFAGHLVSHYSPGARQIASEKRDVKQSELFAYFIDRLKATEEFDGSRLFDHITVSYGTNIRSLHFLDNCPTLVTGRGAGFLLGQQIVMPETQEPLCNLWLSMLQGSGLEVESQGDSTGTISNLMV